MTTWANFRDGVKGTYWSSGNPTAAQQYRAIADYAHSLFVRQVESDLPLAKSFMDSYTAQKLSYAGSRVTASLNTVIAAVKALLTIDADTAGPEAMLANAIEAGLNDFNGTADNFDVLLLNAAMDMQRHVPFYQGRNETLYYFNTAGLSNQGFVSKIALPEGFRIQSIWTGRFHTILAEGVLFAAGDIVQSNGRFYSVITGGTLTAGQLGNGLQSQDYSVEALGALTFRLHHGQKMIPVRKFPWQDREALFSGRITSGPWYTISPEFEALWLYPPLIDNRQFFMLEWTGVKTSYADSDVVTFDPVAQSAAAQYVKAMLLKDAAGDRLNAAAALQLYQGFVRKAIIDNQDREVGTTNTTPDLLYMNLGRSPWWWGFLRRLGPSGECGHTLSGNTPITAGLTELAVVFSSAFTSIPAVVPSLIAPSGDPITVNAKNVTQNGFTAFWEFPIPAGWILSWIATGPTQ